MKYWAGGFGTFDGAHQRLKKFIEQNYWAAIDWEKGSKNPEAIKIRKLFSQIKIRDKFLIKGLGGRFRLNVDYAGQIIKMDKKKEKLYFKKLDIESYNGIAPKGEGAGKWFDTLLEVSRPDLIKKFFGDDKTISPNNDRSEIYTRRRRKKAGASINTTEQFRKGTDGYVTNPKHNKIQKLFVEHLKNKYKSKGYKVEFEENFVDIKLFQPNCITFYEVKPYNTAEYCIRIGLGQLLSYVFFDTSKKRKNIKIVGPYPPTEDEKEFISSLKDTLKIDFEYEYFEVS